LPEVEIVFPFAPGQGVSTSRARLADACEGLEDPAPDLVLLKPDIIPRSVLLLQLAIKDTFEIGVGYVHAGLVGREIANPTRVRDVLVMGEIADHKDPRGLRQFSSSNRQDYELNWGASGSPVFLEGGMQLAGIISLSEIGANEGGSHLREAFVVPATKIHKYLASRLALDQQAAKRGIDPDILKPILAKLGE
jgi:hypothetical protein